jgi:hypothetical protein
MTILQYLGVEDVDDALNRGTLVNSDKLLRKDYANAGSKFIVEQYSNLEDPRLKVKTWNDDGTPGPIVTFSSWARNKGLTPADSEWQDKVPMVIKDTETGEAVAFLHDVEWYNPVTTAFKEEPDVQEDLIDEAQTLVREVRARVRDNGSATIEVTKKRIGTIVKTPEDSILTLQKPILKQLLRSSMVKCCKELMVLYLILKTCLIKMKTLNLDMHMMYVLELMKESLWLSQFFVIL